MEDINKINKSIHKDETTQYNFTDVVSLNNMSLPQDVKRLDYSQCDTLCKEIRAILIDTVSKNGGHLASNLGTVELTVALHRAFNSPADKIVWDVGHQCYTHKLLTGRYKDFDTLRKEGGISGFPKPTESEHDAYISGHSSTSISVACGIAQAMKLKGNNTNYAIAVIGDGAFTGGLAYEGLNNGGNTDLNLIIVLNQNDMSISKNIGGFAQYLSRIRQREGYVNTKLAVKKTLDKVPFGKNIGNVISHSKSAVKGAFLENNIFEALGYIYIGVVDGHNVEAMEKALNTAKKYKRPVVVHVHTTKGKGYVPAENNPNIYHGVSDFDILTGKQNKSNQESYSSAFGKYINKLGDMDEKICTITAAMKENTGLNMFAKRHPERCFDVGIAEQHAVTFSGGLASMGYIPVFAVYSTFLQRAYDQIVHDIAIPKLHVVFAIDRAGIVGDDGETHQGIFDVAFLSTIPNCTIYAPACIQEMKWSFDRAIYHDTAISCVRYPRGVDETSYPKQDTITDYTIEHNIGSNTLVIGYGRTYDSLYSATKLLNSEYIFTDILKLTKIFPIPEDAIKECIGYKQIVFFEEGIESGGVAEHFMYSLCKAGFKGDFKVSAIDGFVYAGSVDSCLERYSLTTKTMHDYVKNALRKVEATNES